MKIPEDVISGLKEARGNRIFVQFPEGLKLRIQGIKTALEKEGFEVVLSLERIWGDCDLRLNDAKLFGCDAILEVAHQDFGVKRDMPVVYWDYFSDVDPLPALKKELHKLDDFSNIGIVASLQFLPAMEKARKFLEESGKKTFSGKTEQYIGQILGCRVGAGKQVEDKVDCFLCVSAGRFYPTGLSLETDKPVFNLDLELGEIVSMDGVRKKMLKVAAWNRAVFRDAKKVGLMVSTKLGQYRDVFGIKKMIEKLGKEVYVLAMDEFDPGKLEGLKLDVAVNAACPRVFDDHAKYKIPMVNIDDVLGVMPPGSGLWKSH